MHVASIELENWLPFRGVHRLEIGPGSHGVVARAVGRPEASNWKGKTSLLAAVRFALFGTHPARTEDEWITRGEEDGAVRLTLSDGLHVERTRIRGEATRLVVRAPSGSFAGGILTARDEAQALVERWIGLSERDFLATSFFEQKRMHRFVAARPGERFADVAEWVRLGPLRRAEEETRKKIAALVDRETRLVANATLLRARLAEAGDVASLKVRWIELADAARRADDEVRRLEIAADEERERRSLRDAAREHEAAKRELASIAVPELVRRDPSAAGEAFAELRARGEETKRLRVLSRAEFDGACPVAPIACPAREQINGRAAESRKALARASAAENDARAAYERASAADRTAEVRARERAAVEARAGFLRRRIAETEPAARRLGELPREGVQTGAEDELRLRARPASKEATQASARAAETVRQAARDASELATIEAELRQIRDEAATLREAATILGRTGAQRRIARGAVEAIERGANVRLAAAGIDLSVRLTWGRETGEPAAACDVCGAPFPSSRAVKACRCGVERGPKVVEELGCELSAVSGAAEDLAGVALSLSAAAWIRGDRTSGWGVALLDEPFGSLDAPNRRALASALGAMLSPSGGWEQALVVAHHEGVMDALPGRIQITAGPHGSWARVVS